MLHLGTCDTAKKGVKVVFTSDESYFLVADKFGDVLRFSTKDISAGGEVILGHLSMLMDICLISDDTYIVTADRDEKIRISHYANTYNIEVCDHLKFWVLMHAHTYLSCVFRYKLNIYCKYKFFLIEFKIP